MVVRCTAKALSLLGVRPAGLDEVEPSDDDWYLNLLWLERRKCLLLVHAGTLFAVFAPDVLKPRLTPFGPWVVALVEGHLVSEGLPPDALGRLDPVSVRLARTASRNVLGTMNRMAFELEYFVELDGGLARTDPAGINRHLRRSPYTRGRDYVRPIDLVRERALFS